MFSVQDYVLTFIFTTNSSKLKLRRDALENHSLQKQRLNTIPVHILGTLSVDFIRVQIES